MKKQFLAACALALALLAMAGCSGSESDSPRQDAASNSEQSAQTPDTAAPDAPAAEEDSAPASDAAAGEAAANAKTVSPLPTGIDLAQLEDCTVAVSFGRGDAYVDDTGAMQLKATVYAYDTYDMVDISTLQPGDQITICRENVKVTSVERDESNAVILNGGPENGGYRLTATEGTSFCVNSADGTPEYYALGEATIPVSTDFELEDLSDPEQGTRIYYAGDLLTDDAGITYDFVPANTTITIQGGSVVRMQRVQNA